MTNKIRWMVDQSHSSVSFAVRHLMISTQKGTVQEFDGSIYTTGKDFLTAEVDIWLAPASIKTGDEDRDEHLKSVDFFDVANYRQISFISNTIIKVEHSDLYQVWGQLTIKEITRNIQLDVVFGGITTDPDGNEKAGFTVFGKIDRSQFDLTWNSSWTQSGLVIGEEVSISCELELLNTGLESINMRVEHNDADARVL